MFSFGSDFKFPRIPPQIVNVHVENSLNSLVRNVLGLYFVIICFSLLLQSEVYVYARVGLI